MKAISLLLLAFLLLLSCEPKEDEQHFEILKTNLPEVVSYRFLEYQKEPNFEAVNIDMLKNLGEMISRLEQLACQEKYTGIELTQNDTIYKLMGWTGCPDDATISCYFRVNRIYIKNDSLQSLSHNRDSMLPIRELRNEIEKVTKKEFSFRWNENILKTAIIEVFVDDKFPIEKTKEILKEITKVFKKINTENGKDYFEYQINFTGSSWLDVPPPPPPAPPVPEIVEVVEDID